jgi:uncharacterized membrane protein
MVIPRFSIQWLMGLTAVCAVLSLIVSYAVRGDVWAVAATTALGSGLLLMLLYVVAFLIAWLVAQVENALRRRGAAADSPFQPGSTPSPSPFAPIAPPIASDLGDASPPPMTG